MRSILSAVRSMDCLRLSVAAVAALGALALGAVPAAGSTVEATAGGPRITYRAHPGETNRVSVDRNIKPPSRPDSEATAFTIQEQPGRRGSRAVRIAPLGDCVSVLGPPPSPAMSCPVPSSRVQLSLGDRSDFLLAHTTHIRVQAEGGTGDDALTGGWASDVFYGQTGDDALYGGRGDDILWGDSLPRDHGDDLIVDRFGDNQLTGEGGRDSLLDGDGGSRLFGGSGSDGIRDEGGEDRIRAGPGNDNIGARDGKRDFIDCGSGDDRAIVDRRDDVRLSDCEHIVYPRFGR